MVDLADIPNQHQQLRNDVNHQLRMIDAEILRFGEQIRKHFRLKEAHETLKKVIFDFGVENQYNIDYEG